jgi:hypothetical protein
MVIRIKEDYDVRCNLTQFVLKYIYAYVLTFTTSTQIVMQRLVIVLRALAHSPVMPYVPSPISSDLYLLVIVPYAVAQSPVMPYVPCIAASSMQRGLVPY